MPGGKRAELGAESGHRPAFSEQQRRAASDTHHPERDDKRRQSPPTDDHTVDEPAPGADEASQTATYLDTLLDSQDRRSSSEEEFIRAAANYQIAIVNLERAKGKLLNYSDVTVMRSKDGKGLPQLYLEKGARDGKSARAGK